MLTIEFDPRLTWSVAVNDLRTGEDLLSVSPATVLKTASVGKIFLLAEVARRIVSGELDAAQELEPQGDDRVADSGLLYMFGQPRQRIDDLCLLVGAVSDNMATNMLLRLVGLEQVQDATRAFGYEQSGLRDRVRLNRPVDDPLTLSRGSAAELIDVVERIQTDRLVSPEVCARLRKWLSADTDLSMVAGAFSLDPLAHMERDRTVRLWHKTGTISDARIDVGCVTGAGDEGVSYAVLANWPLGQDLRDSALGTMRQIGEMIRRRIGLPAA